MYRNPYLHERFARHAITLFQLLGLIAAISAVVVAVVVGVTAFVLTVAG